MRSGSDSRSPADRVFFAGFIIAIIVLSVIAGSLLTVAGIPPGPQLARAYEGGRAIYAKLFHHDDVYRSDLWHPARTDERGVTINDASRTSPGVTLYTSGHEAAAYLLSMDGEVLHQWQRHFSDIWNESAAVKDPQPDSHVYMRKAMLAANGDLLALYEGAGDTPYGYGLVKLDKESNVIWSYLQSAHHDFDIAPDGRIFVLTQEIVDVPLPQLDHLVSPRLDDFVVILSSEGEEIRKIPLLAAVDTSDYRQLLFGISSFALADALHTNSVHVITDQEARQFPYAKAGQLLISFREPSAIGVVDPDQDKLVWAVKAYWAGQHDPHILDNGNILLFDNRGNFNKPEGRSRVIEFDPRTMAIAWQYAGTATSPLESDIRSYAQRLPNGNTLITESNGGRILEVDQDKEVVWEFVNPVRGGPDNAQIPIICKAQRLDRKVGAAFM
jgi:hypothetical protein